MCVTAIAAGAMLVSAGIGAVSSIQTANNNYKLATYESKMRQKQLRDRAATARLEAMDQENARASEFDRMRSSALAVLGAQGIGENITFLQGADPEQRKAFFRDVSAIRLGLSTEQSGIRDGIQAAIVSQSVARANRANQHAAAVGQFISQSASAASYFDTYRRG